MGPVNSACAKPKCTCPSITLPTPFVLHRPFLPPRPWSWLSSTICCASCWRCTRRTLLGAAWYCALAERHSRPATRWKMRAWLTWRQGPCRMASGPIGEWKDGLRAYR
eukprot:1157626-Pelagomonas_calceolata.AAC.9